MAACVGHGVDRARPAVRLASRPLERAPTKPGLGLGRVVPVERRTQERRPSTWRSDPGIGLRPPGLDQKHAIARIGTQAVRQNAARRPGADDDVIELIATLRAGCPALAACHGGRNHGCRQEQEGTPWEHWKMLSQNSLYLLPCRLWNSP